MRGHGAPDIPGELDSPDAADRSDGELLRSISHKESTEARRAAWGIFYRRHATFLYANCRRAFARTLGEAGVEDLVSETFLRVVKSAAAQFTPENVTDSEAGRSRTRAWLFTIAEHLVLDKLRGQKAAPLFWIDLDPWAEPEEEPNKPSSELILEVCRVMHEVLNETEQDVIRTTIFWYAAGLDAQRLPESELMALTERCGITRDNVRKIRERAYIKLKAALEPIRARFSARTQAND